MFVDEHIHTALYVCGLLKGWHCSQEGMAEGFLSVNIGTLLKGQRSNE